MFAVRVLRDGVPVREALFQDTPVRIGRSAAADFILTDPSVSRDHARIDRDEKGELILIDGSGTNGLYAGPKRVAFEPVSGRLRARLGLAEIEIEEVSADATQPISLQDLHRLDQRRTPLTWAKYIAIAVTALLLDTVLGAEFWSPWNSQRAVSLVWLGASTVVAILIIASILLGILKAAGRKLRMADVLRHFAVFSWLAPLTTAGLLIAYYVLPDRVLSMVHGWAPTLAAVVFMAQAAAIRRAGPSRWFRAMLGLAFLLIATGIEFTQDYAARRTGQSALDHSLQMPVPILGAGPALSFAEYSAAVAAAGERSQAQAP